MTNLEFAKLALQYDESTPLATIENADDLWRFGVIPNFFVFLVIFASMKFAFDRFNSYGASGLAGIASVFLISLVCCYFEECMQYQRRVTVHLWYAFIEWVVLCSVPVVLLVVLIDPSTPFWTFAVAVLLNFFIYAFKATKKGHAKRFILIGFFHEVKSVARFYIRILSLVISRSVWVVKTIGLAIFLFFIKRKSRCASTAMDTKAAIPNCKIGGQSLDVIHLSDLHLRKEDCPLAENGSIAKIETRETLLKLVTNRVEQSNGKCIVIITGDLTDSGSLSDYAEANIFLKKLRNIKIQDSNLPVVILPGNHDLSFNPCIWNIESKVSKGVRWWAHALGTAVRPFRDPYKIKCGRFYELMSDCGVLASAGSGRAKLFNFCDLELSVVTLCTAVPSGWATYNAAGVFSEEDLSSLETFSSLFKKRVIVAFHHHVHSPSKSDPFLENLKSYELSAMGASGSLGLASTLIDGLGRTEKDTLVIHGHTHIGRSYSMRPIITTSSESLPVYCSPSALEGPDPRFFVYQIGDNRGQVITVSVS
jgi:hypothetical protein